MVKFVSDVLEHEVHLTKHKLKSSANKKASLFDWLPTCIHVCMGFFVCYCRDVPQCTHF